MPRIKNANAYMKKLDTLWDTKDWFEKILKDQLENEDDGTILNALIWIENAHHNLKSLMED